MPQKSWAVGEEVLAADFNTYLQNQCVPAFTNTAQRDSQWPSPPNGAVCVTVDTGTYWQRAAGAWMRPFGVWGYAEATTTQGSIAGTVVDLTGLTVTYTSPGLRRVRVTVQTALQSTVAGDYGRVDITDSSGTVTYQSAQTSLGSSSTAVSCVAIETPAAGSITFKGRAVRTVGTGTLSSVAAAVQPASILVEDLGP